MSRLVVNNIITIGLTILILALLMLILKWGLNLFQKLGEKFAKRLATALLFRGSLLISEIILIIIFVIMIFVKDYPILTVTLMLVTFLIAIVGAEVRQRKPNAFSFFQLLPVFLNKDMYIVNRISLLMNESSSVMTLFIALFMTFTFFTFLEWPEPYYFVSFLVLPVYLSFWVYFTFNKLKLRLNNEDNINNRRLVSYSCLAIYTFHDLYVKFFMLMHNQKQPDSLDFTNLFVYSSTVVFITLERVLKTLADDYKKFKRETKDIKNTKELGD